MTEASKKDQEKPVSQSTEEIFVEGMTCSNCAEQVKRAINQQGADEVNVDFASGRVRYKASQPLESENLRKAVEGAGFSVKSGSEDEKTGLITIRNKVLFASAFALPLFLSMLLPFEWLRNPWVQLGLATPVYVLGVLHFGRSALGSLRQGVPNMDVLIFIGSSAAFFYSLTGTLLALGSDYLFYETAAMIIALILLGNYFEKRSVQKTTGAIDDLMALQPAKAKLVQKSEKGIPSIEEVPIHTIEVGQVLQINSGDQIPLDSEILWGKGHVDESMITGESLPVEKTVGNQLIGGTLLKNGTIQAKVTATGDDTVLSRIIELVKDAQASKPNIQRLADRISAVFVPVVVSIAVLTFVLSWGFLGISGGNALLRAIAVLVISCPCAMGLATPTAVMVGIGKAAKKGILIRGGATLESFAGIKNMVFDKTGTLTTGNFRITNLALYNGNDEATKSLIHQLEQYSSHPIAQSIVKELPAGEQIPFKSIKETEGLGLEAETQEGDVYKLGSTKVLANGNNKPEHQVYLTKNGEIMAGIDLADEWKDEVQGVIDYLKQNDIKTILLSGDQETKTRDMAEKVGMNHYYAEQQPEEKLMIIEQYANDGVTAMVGDGINDAPSLSRADVGISLGQATEIAMQSAEVLLLDGRLETLEQAHRVSRQTLTTIKQNLFWAFFYNVLAIPVAAAGLLSPMIAALAMAFSDVMVVGNSLRLKARK